MESPKDVIQQNLKKFIEQLEAKDLLMKIKGIFPDSVAQEIARDVDRHGNSSAIDMILEHLPRHDNWVECFYQVLQDMKKPGLAKLFEKFRKVPQQHSHSLPAQRTATEQGEGPKYTDKTRLIDIDYFPFLREIYPHVQADWKSFIKEKDLSLNCTLLNLLEYFGDKNINAYYKLKEVTNIEHVLVRQASGFDIQSSLLPDTENSLIIADQRKAMEKLEGNTTQSLPIDFHSNMNLKKKTYKFDEKVSAEEKKEVPPVAEERKEVPPVAEVEKEVPPVAEVEKVVEPVAEVEVIDDPEAQEPEDRTTNRSWSSTIPYVSIAIVAAAILIYCLKKT